MVLGEPRRPVSAVGEVLLAGGPCLDKPDDVLLGRIRETRRVAEIEQRAQEADQVDVIVPARWRERLEVLVRLGNIAVQNQSRMIEPPPPTVARVHGRFKLAKILDDPVEILRTPGGDFLSPVVGCRNRLISSMQRGQRREQQSNEEREAVFHVVFHNSANPDALARAALGCGLRVVGVGL